MFGHVRLNHAKMLSCGSQRAEASSPIAQRPSGVTAWRLNRRYMISTPGTAQQAGLGVDRKVLKFLVRHPNSAYRALKKTQAIRWRTGAPAIQMLGG